MQSDQRPVIDVRSGRERAGRGFTLVELLVSIGIISILTGLVLPVVNRSRERAKQVQCAGQLHHLGVALAAYAANFGGSFPSWSLYHTWPRGLPEDTPDLAWTVQLAPYFVDPGSPVYHCPSFRSDRQCVTYFIAGRWAASQGRVSTRLQDIRLSSVYVLGGDNTNLHTYPPSFGGTDPIHIQPDADPMDVYVKCEAFPFDDGGFLQHPFGNNLLFGDFHVQPFKKYESAAMTCDVNKMRSWEDVSIGSLQN